MLSTCTVITYYWKNWSSKSSKEFKFVEGVQDSFLFQHVLLVTSAGDIDIELWSKEAPKACRNFVQLCMEGYYDESEFHRMVKDFIIQGGDPTGTGEGGESIYGQPFKDEVHSRLRFVRRGLVAMANSGPNDNGSQFFFTLGPTQELQNKHTIFGKVAGNTIFNLLKLQECEIGANERPLYPHKIVKTEILSNPYDDIIPRQIKKVKTPGDESQKRTKSQSKATKNFNLLSFGEEAEEDEEQTILATKDMKGRSKSSHDLTNDPRLSAVPAVNKRRATEAENEDGNNDAIDQADDEHNEDDIIESIRKKLKKDDDQPDAVLQERRLVQEEKTDESRGNRQDDDSKEKTNEELKQEVLKLKKELLEARRRKHGKDEKQQPDLDEKADYIQQDKYVLLRNEQPKKGVGRENMTLSILAKFQSKLQAAKIIAGGYSDDEGDEEEKRDVREEKKDAAADDDADDDDDDISWMHHKLKFESQKLNAPDTYRPAEERFEISDPRNPMTMRRREQSKQTLEKR